MKKGFFLFFLLVSKIGFARIDFDRDYSDLYKPKTSYRLGFLTTELGLSKLYFLDKSFRDPYNAQFGRLGLMPLLRFGYFFDLSPFAVGFGAQASYVKGSGESWKEDKSGFVDGSVEELVYVPYQVFVAGKFYFWDSQFVTDLSVGYEEAFIENRRQKDQDGKALITEAGKHWNSYLTVGAGIGFSLKRFGKRRDFTGKGAFALSDVFVKIYYEHNFDLRMKYLFGGRAVTDTFRMAKGHGGIAFSFEL